MTTRDFLKPKNFKIKAKSIAFESTKFINDLDKKKIYINFVKLLNNHFKFTLFKKNLYQHFHTHCGFIAHYNLHGFYGEYFETASTYHFNVNNYSTPAHECMGYMNQSSTLSHGEQFYAIYEEINGSREGLGSFISNLLNQHCYNDDYSDINAALKEAISEYLEIWRLEIRKAIKAYDKYSKDEKAQQLKIAQKKVKLNIKTLATETSNIEDETSHTINLSSGQSNLFDFLEA